MVICKRGDYASQTIASNIIWKFSTANLLNETTWFFIRMLYLYTKTLSVQKISRTSINICLCYIVSNFMIITMILIIHYVLIRLTVTLLHVPVVCCNYKHLLIICRVIIRDRNLHYGIVVICFSASLDVAS